MFKSKLLRPFCTLCSKFQVDRTFTAFKHNTNRKCTNGIKTALHSARRSGEVGVNLGGN